MSIDDLHTIWNVISNQDLWGKIILIILIPLYTLFAIVVSRQIDLMSHIIDQVDFSPIFKFLGVLNIILSIVLLIFVVLL